MFGNKSLGDKLKETLTEYIDEKFEEYRGQLANDLSSGLSGLAGIVAIWSLFIVCLIFIAITIAMLLGWFLSNWMNDFAYVLSFLIVAVVLLTSAYFILINKRKYIEKPVYKIMSKTLRNPHFKDTEVKVESKMSEEDTIANETEGDNL